MPALQPQQLAFQQRFPSMKELPDFSTGRVLVLGDVMMDRYWHGPTSRISPEAPVPVVRVEQEEFRPGGAANVALNIAALGGHCHLMGLTGADHMAEVLAQRLEESRVVCHFERVPDVPTITKLRVVSRHQQLIRLDFEGGFAGFDPTVLLEEFTRLLSSVDLVVLSDYGKGTLGQPQAFINAARQAGKPVLIDPKGSDFGKYRGATLITPNLHEFEVVAGSCPSEADLEERGGRMIEDCGLEALLITRGEQGMSLLEKGRPARHMPTRAREVFDVTGAGDTVIATLAASLACGVPLESATHMANAAAGVVVGKLGTATVSGDELWQALHDEQAIHRGVIDEEGLMQAVGVAKARGETIVVTNGCFDILHAGHVTYLEEAAKLGDRLIVAVNVDQTVRALKGEDRPVNRVEQRMRVLAALGCVDWVVPFAEETPERLICRLKPDFLVKGGDNDPDKIPGAVCVRQSGGQVMVMSYIDGVSTTRIVQSIRER